MTNENQSNIRENQHCRITWDVRCSRLERRSSVGVEDEASLYLGIACFSRCCRFNRRISSSWLKKMAVHRYVYLRQARAHAIAKYKWWSVKHTSVKCHYEPIDVIRGTEVTWTATFIWQWVLSNSTCICSLTFTTTSSSCSLSEKASSTSLYCTNTVWNQHNEKPNWTKRFALRSLLSKLPYFWIRQLKWKRESPLTHKHDEFPHIPEYIQVFLKTLGERKLIIFALHTW